MLQLESVNKNIKKWMFPLKKILIVKNSPQNIS